MAAVLKGITWGHSRGITPLLAASQRYAELHSGVEITWEKRSLQQFADAPIEALTKKYDLLIIDHPWVGTADATRCVLPLNKYISQEYLDDQAHNSVGDSHASYNYGNSQWALAIDAATPAASFRKDLLEKNNVPIPSTWEDVLQLAHKGKVAVPAIPIDLLMNFYTFCIAHGEEPFTEEGEIVSEAIGKQAIETMRELYSVVDKKMFSYNPIAVAELMSTTNDYWYCPFAYCYSNYSRKGYAKNLLHYNRPVAFQGHALRTTIGGTGLAISAFSSNVEEAVSFAQWIVLPELQRALYVQHGGQPGHRKAWEDKSANQLTSDFFKNILPVMDSGFVRPRYHGHLHFQDNAGKPLQECLQNDSDAGAALEKMNAIYRESIVTEKLTAV